MKATHLVDQLAEFVSGTRLNLGKSVITVIRDSVIDTLGCILVGAGEEVALLSHDAVAGQAAGNSPVYGTGLMTNPETAAFLNASAGHALEMDDWEIPGNSHSSVVMLPALLAAASKDGLSGQSLCEAYTMGFEVVACLGEAINYKHYANGWHATGTLASIGAAAAVSRLWGLNSNQTAHAISIATSRAAGLTCQFGSHAKALQAGFAAENALRSARLARAGLTGRAHVFEGERGYFEITAHDDHRLYKRPFSMLGEALALEKYGQVIKPYPSCGYTHRIIDCARQLKQQGLNPTKIANIKLHLPDFHAAILPFSQPTNRHEAIFSLPFCAAMGLIHGGLSLVDLDREAWLREDIKSLISLTQVIPFGPQCPGLNFDPDEPDRMVITMRSGEIREAQVVYPTGAPQNPLSSEALLAKFEANSARFRPVNEQEIKQLLNWPSMANLLPLLSIIGIKTVAQPGR